jgi:hypothetical protein
MLLILSGDDLEVGTGKLEDYTKSPNLLIDRSNYYYYCYYYRHCYYCYYYYYYYLRGFEKSIEPYCVKKIN